MLLIENILSQIQSSSQKTVMPKARHYVDEGHVLHTRFSDGFFMCRVKDDQGQIFTSHADLKKWNESNYKCHCGQAMPCVHLISGLMQWVDVNVKAHAKPQNVYSKISWMNVDDDVEPLKWQEDLSGSTDTGFQYQLSVEQQDQTWNLIDIIVYLLEAFSFSSLMQKDEQSIFQIIHQNGRVLRIAWWRIKVLLQHIIESKKTFKHSKLMLGQDWQSIKALQRLNQSMVDENNIWSGNQAWQNMSWLLQLQIAKPDEYIPKGLTCELRHYQTQGVAWLKSLFLSGFGGILADDMGLGKTIQTLSYLLNLKEQHQLTKPALVVVPTSLLANWQDENRQFTPDLNITLFHGKNKTSKAWFEADIVITSYGMVQRHASIFKTFDFSHIILDEAQLIKNFQSQKSQVLKSLKGNIRFCLTGTPMENHLGELWSLVDFVVPNLLGSRAQFRKHYQLPIETYQNQEVQQALLSRIQPFILRRSKQQVLTNLPAKTKMIQKISLEEQQLELYETLRALLADRVQLALAEKGLVQSRWVVLDALLKLRQVCCDPRLLPINWNPQSTHHSVKLDYLMEMLDNLIAEGRSVLVFSQFTKMLHLIEQRLQEKRFDYQILTGKTQKRDELVKRFQQGEVPIFLLSLKAGGLGLNLTKADTVIHYEPWWNPAVSAQATDRIYRIGQEQPVFEYHLIASGTIEEAMMKLQQKKFNLFDATIEASAQLEMQWTEEYIMRFFAPIG
jgi:SNF2 family DNA or RNA helicase